MAAPIRRLGHSGSTGGEAASRGHNEHGRDVVDLFCSVGRCRAHRERPTVAAPFDNGGSYGEAVI
jgi:hypothetical protein